MAKVKGLEGFLGQMDNLANIGETQELKDAVGKAWSLVTDKIRENARSSFVMQTGLLIDPNVIKTITGIEERDGKKVLIAQAGVFSDIGVMSSYPHPNLNRNRNPKDIPPANIAWFLEFGVQPHYLYKDVRARKTPVSAEAMEQKKKGIHPGIKPTPFISNAFDETYEAALADFTKELEKLIKQAITS